MSRTDVRVRFARRLLCLIVAAVVVSACGPTISKYNATAYKQATSLKVESTSLMEEATEPYKKHAEDVRALEERLEKAHEFAKGRPNNEISAKQWEILIDQDGNLLGGFLERWERKSSLNETFVSQKQDQIADAFDTIIELESGKIKPEDVQEGS